MALAEMAQDVLPDAAVLPFAPRCAARGWACVLPGLNDADVRLDRLALQVRHLAADSAGPALEQCWGRGLSPELGPRVIRTMVGQLSGQEQGRGKWNARPCGQSAREGFPRRGAVG